MLYSPVTMRYPLCYILIVIMAKLSSEILRLFFRKTYISCDFVLVISVVKLLFKTCLECFLFIFKIVFIEVPVFANLETHNITICLFQ